MNSDQPNDAGRNPQEQREKHMQRVQVAMAIFMMSIGLYSLTSVAGNARFESYHTLDVIRLMTAGAGFAVAIVLVVQFLKVASMRGKQKKE